MEDKKPTMITGESIQEHWVLNSVEKSKQLSKIIKSFAHDKFLRAMRKIVQTYLYEQILIQTEVDEDHIEDYTEQTIQRLIKSFDERFNGYQATLNPMNTGESIYEQLSFYPKPNISIPKVHLTASEVDIICIKNIEFTSTCEHHWLPIIGTMDIAYIPITHVYGLSKIPRIVNIFAHRLQQQERLGYEISRAIVEYGNITKQGVFDGSYKIMAALVRIKAEHTCMSCRGVQQKKAITITEHFYCLPFEDAQLSSFVYNKQNEELARNAWATYDEVFHEHAIVNPIHRRLIEFLRTND